MSVYSAGVGVFCFVGLLWAMAWMRFVWRLVSRPPAGVGLRTLVGLLLWVQGLGYLYLVATDGRRTTSYQLQAEIAPLWLFGVVLVGVGVGLLGSRRRRRTALGRMIAGVGFAVVALIGWTWGLAGAVTAVGTYAIYGWALFLEAAFVDEGDL